MHHTSDLPEGGIVEGEATQCGGKAPHHPSLKGGDGKEVSNGGDLGQKQAALWVGRVRGVEGSPQSHMLHKEDSYASCDELQ